jgi:hypothetical protein
MSVVRNDLTREQIRSAISGMEETVRQKAFDAGSTVTYAQNGKIVQETSDGKVTELGSTTAGTTVEVRKKNWKIG